MHLIRSLIFLIISISALAQPDTTRIAQLLKDGSDYVLRPGNEKTDLDSALIFFNQALAISRTIRSDKWTNLSLLWIGDTYLEGNDLSLGVPPFREVITYYHKKGDQRREAETWTRLADCIAPDNPTLVREKVKALEKARQLYYMLGDTLRALDALKGEADAHLYDGKLGLAEQQLLNVLESYKAIRYRPLHYTYDLLRAIARIKGRLVDEVFYSMEMVRSLDAPDGMDNPGLASFLYLRAGTAFASAGMWDRSLYYCRKAWALNNGIEAETYYTTMTHVVSGLLSKDSAEEALNIVAATIRQSPPDGVYPREMLSMARGRCYSAMGNYIQAEREFAKLAALTHEDKEIHRPMYADSYRDMLLNIGNFYLRIHRYSQADIYAKKLRTIVDNLVTMNMRARLERFYSQVDSALGRYELALSHFQAYQQMSDSLAGVQKAVQIQELELKYSLEQKDNDIRLQAANIQLLTKENQVQQDRVTQARTLRNMMIIGILLLLFLVGLVYNRYRLKQRKNRELESKQKEITFKNHQLENSQQEISEKNHQLQRLLNENEWLLREVHHRVKNNLQVIMSLLKSQSAYVRDEGTLKVVLESQHRIYAMSLIHQKLYKSNNTFSIGMPEYIGDLVEYLRYSFATAGGVSFDLQMEPLDLDVHQAVPVGLIINEVITNSFKYAFPWSENDGITVRLSATEAGWITLFIADNGRGLPDGFDLLQVDTFGMQLIAGLTEDLGGFLNIDNQRGTAYCIQFRKEEPGKMLERESFNE
jgi:two-component sensor histidine kinase